MPNGSFARVAGAIHEQEGPEKILAAIRLVLSGQIYLSAKMSTRILASVSGRSAHPNPHIAA